MIARSTFLPLFAAVLSLPLVTPGSAKDKIWRHQGEILGINREESTVTVRDRPPEGKELYVFHVLPETLIRDRSSGLLLELADLAPGDKVAVRSRHEPGRRVAVRIVVKIKKRAKERRDGTMHASSSGSPERAGEYRRDGIDLQPAEPHQEDHDHLLPVVE